MRPGQSPLPTLPTADAPREACRLLDIPKLSDGSSPSERAGRSLRDFTSEKLFSVHRELPRLGLGGAREESADLDGCAQALTERRVALHLCWERNGQTRGPELPGAAPTGQPLWPPTRL